MTSKRAEQSAPWRASAGFTLVELMVVVALIGILAAFSVPTLSRSMRRSEARDSANAVAQLFRTARVQAMGRGEIVLLEIETHAGGEVTMSVAPRTDPTDPDSPVMRSCRLLIDFDAALLAPRFDTLSGVEIEALRTPLSELFDPDVQFFDNGEGSAVYQFCFAPDGRVYGGADNVAAVSMPVSMMSCPERGFLLAVGRTPPGGGAVDARAMESPIDGVSLDALCVPSSSTPAERTTASMTRDAAYMYVVEVTHSGAVVVE